MMPSAAPHGRRLLQAAALASLGALPAAEATGGSHAEAAAGAPSPAAAPAPDPQPWPLTALPAGAPGWFSTSASAWPWEAATFSTQLWGTTLFSLVKHRTAVRPGSRYVVEEVYCSWHAERLA